MAHKTQPFDHLHTAFDIEDPLFATQYDAVLEHLISRCPVAHSQRGPGYTAFNRYAQVRKAGQDWRSFSSADGWMLDPPEGNLPILPEDCDPPYHNQWRQVLNPYFTAQAVDKLEEPARRYADELIAQFAARGECHFVAEFAAQLPGLILFQHILPVPVADLPQLFENIDAYSFGPLAERTPAFGRVYDYLEALLRDRAKQPACGDIIDVILAGVQRDGDPCPWADKVSITLDLVFGGLATTTHAMCGAIYELARSPSARQAVSTNDRALAIAVEETVRLHAPVVMVGRTVTKACELGGSELKAGDRIALNFAAASRDPEVCSQPDQFDVGRSEVVHTAFGVGPHRCIGEHLARLEIRIAIAAFLAAIPEFELAPGTTPSFESGQLRTMTDLQLCWRT